MNGQPRPDRSPTPWALFEMRTCFTIRDANGWGVCQLSFGYNKETKDLRRNDALRIIEAVNVSCPLDERTKAIFRWRKAYIDKGIKLPDNNDKINFLRLDKAERRIVPITQAPVDQILFDADLMERCKDKDEYQRYSDRRHPDLVGRD